MKNIVLAIIIVCIYQSTHAQTIFSEDFENLNLPIGWVVNSIATDGGWKVGNFASLSSQYFSIASNGSNGIIATNDDACNCNKIDDNLITPQIDLTNTTQAILSFDLYYDDALYQGFQESAKVEISTDGITWEHLADLSSTGQWENRIINLADYTGNPIYLSFDYSDGNGWLFGCALDNIEVLVPFELDATINNHRGLKNAEVGSDFHIPLSIFNNSITEINSIEVSYSIDNGTPVSQTFDNLTLEPFKHLSLEFSNEWEPSASGLITVEVAIQSVNGENDNDLTNNILLYEVNVFDKIEVANIIDNIVQSNPSFIEVASASNQLRNPTDLDFFPIYGKDELWVVNQRTENEGGSTLIVKDASTSPNGFIHQVDGNAWHFMALPTAIAFSSDNHNFATTEGLQDANHQGGTFTGPALWSSDPEIYAQPSGGNGSHLDMLHGSPFSMGIAHEVENVFWVYDDWNKDIVRYDFAKDHGPGNADHSDAIVRRHKEIGIAKDGDIPNHMVLDKSSGWLYFVDNGNSRVMRLDINSGEFESSLPQDVEPLAEHSKMKDFTVETIIDANLSQPCGIDIIGDRLLVSDYSNGDIIVYDMNGFNETGRIFTSEPGITGIKVGPDGAIWYTNRIMNKLVKVEKGLPSSTKETLLTDKVTITPNPNKGIFNVEIAKSRFQNSFMLSIYNNYGKRIISKIMDSHSELMQLSDLPSGVYTIVLQSKSNLYFEKLILQK